MALLLRIRVCNQIARSLPLFVNNSRQSCLTEVSARFVSSAVQCANSVQCHQYSTQPQSKKNLKKPKNVVVHEGPLTTRIRHVKVLSLLTSMMGLSSQPILYWQASEMDNIAAAVGVLTIVGFFTYGTPFILHMITKKYVTRIEYDEPANKYIATTLSLFNKEKKWTFTPEDVVQPAVPGMFTSCLVKDIPVFLDSKDFKDVNHYKRIMGYDKPMDFGIQPVKAEETDKKTK